MRATTNHFKEVIMILGEYLKIILLKKGLSQQDLVNKLNAQKGMNVHKHGNATITKFQVSYWINGTENISPLMARRIELALDLEKNSLGQFVQEKRTNMSGYNRVFGKEEGEEEG